MNKRSSEQADQDAQSPGISIHMKAALLAAHWEPIRVSIALVLREATYGDLMTAVALNEIMSKRCAEKISQLMRWSAAVQSKDPAAAFAARTTPPAEFSAEYDDPKKDEPRYNPKNDPEQIETGFESNIGEIKATSQGGLQRPTGPAKTGGGTPAASEISFTALKEIYRKMGEDVAADPEKEKKALRYLAYLNQAFRVMKIDTVEAQAVYLAHAFIESDQFRQFTETQGSKAVKEGKQKWEDDPQKIELDVRDLAARYKLGGTVNPHGEYEFLGRGPVQVTHRRGYIEVIATLEKMAEQYEVEGDAGNLQSCEFAALARDAANAVKADPKNAADPRYTFLVSAALMKSRRADAAVAYTRPTPGVAWTGVDAPSAWVAGGEQAPGSPQAEALLAKSNAYAQIYPILLREARATP
jgi:hypothetical protein